MRITKKFIYAFNILEQLKNAKCVTAHSIAENCQLSKNFVTIIMRDLKKSGILKSKKGPGGGYSLAKDLEQITIGDVFKAVGEDFAQHDLFLNERDCCIRFLEDLDTQILKVSDKVITSYF